MAATKAWEDLYERIVIKIARRAMKVWYWLPWDFKDLCQELRKKLLEVLPYHKGGDLESFISRCLWRQAIKIADGLIQKFKNSGPSVDELISNEEGNLAHCEKFLVDRNSDFAKRVLMQIDVDTILEQCRPEQREAFWLWINGHTFAEISEKQGIYMKTATYRVKMAKNLLQTEFRRK